MGHKYDFRRLREALQAKEQAFQRAIEAYQQSLPLPLKVKGPVFTDYPPRYFVGLFTTSQLPDESEIVNVSESLARIAEQSQLSCRLDNRERSEGSLAMLSLNNDLGLKEVRCYFFMMADLEPFRIK